jgi:hypothetical protein
LALESLEGRCLPSADVVLQWNQVFLDTFKAEHGPGMALGRQAAIVHGAIFDAVNAIDRSYAPLHADIKAPRGASLEAAAAQAAHDTLAELYPTHRATFDATLAADLVGIPPGRARLGVAVGQEAARQMLDWRSADGSSPPGFYAPGSGPGVWQPTPPAFAPPASPQWGHVTPFSISNDAAFRPPAQPALDSAEYTAAFNEVKSIGAANSATRTSEQSEIAQFWYGTGGTYTAPGYWNQIAQGLVQRYGNSLVQNARLFALLNVAQADASFTIWDAKYTYNFWRPVTAIRAADSDGNNDTVADTTWTPFLVTPAHPSYTSGHSGNSGAAVAVLTAYFGTDAIPFSFSSDSLPGVTRSFPSLSAALQECSDSRVFAGIHWRFDVAVGQSMGLEVGSYVVAHSLLPVRKHDADGDAAAAAAATSLARAQRGAPDGVIQVVGPTAAPAGTSGLVTLASPRAVAPAFQLGLRRPGAEPDAAGSLGDLTVGAALDPAWWLETD